MDFNTFKIFKSTLVVVAALLLVFFIYKIQAILLVFFVAFIIASAIDPFIELLAKKMSRKKALLLTAFLGFIVISSILLPFLNIFLKQALLFFKQLPDYSQKLYSFIVSLSGDINEVGWAGVLTKMGLGRWIDFINKTGVLSDMSQVMDTISGIGQQIVKSSIDLTKNFGYGIVFTFMTSIISLYLLIDKSYLKEKMLNFFPADKRKKAERVGGAISKKVGQYVLSQIIIISIMAALLTIGLSFLQVQFSFILGTIAGFLEIIPGLGPFLAAVIIFLVALAQKPILALWALLVYLVSEWILDNLIRPFIMGKFLHIHPLTLIFSVAAGSMIMGAAGMILAPVIAATVCVLIEEFYLIPVNQKMPEKRKSRVPRRHV